MKITKVIAVLALLLVAIGTASASSLLDSVTLFGGVSAMTNLESDGNSFDFSKLNPDFEFGLMAKLPNNPSFPLEVFEYSSLTFPLSSENKRKSFKGNTILGFLVKIYNTNLMRIGIGIGGAARFYYFEYRSVIDYFDYIKYTYADIGFGALLDFQVNLDVALAITFDIHGSYYPKCFLQITDENNNVLDQGFHDIKYLKVGASIGLSLLWGNSK